MRKKLRERKREREKERERGKGRGENAVKASICIHNTSPSSCIKSSCLQLGQNPTQILKQKIVLGVFVCCVGCERVIYSANTQNPFYWTPLWWPQFCHNIRFELLYSFFLLKTFKYFDLFNYSFTMITFLQCF